MSTPFDWITVAIFAGLIVVFMQRSTGEDEPVDTIWHYLPPSVGCAVANYFGNKGFETEGLDVFDAGGILGIVAVLAYIYYIIKPFPFGRQ